MNQRSQEPSTKRRRPTKSGEMYSSAAGAGNGPLPFTQPMRPMRTRISWPGRQGRWSAAGVEPFEIDEDDPAGLLGGPQIL